MASTAADYTRTLLCLPFHALQLQAKTDEGFVKAAFRLCREHLGIRTVLTPPQFLEQVSTAVSNQHHAYSMKHL